MSLLGWECSRCTYKHTVPGSRCVMCDQPRVTKAQMNDFIKGKTLPKKRPAATTTITPKDTTAAKENRPPPPPRPPPAPAPATPSSSVAPRTLTHSTAPAMRNPYNPYAKPKPKTATSAVPVQPSSSLSTMQQQGKPTTVSGANRTIDSSKMGAAASVDGHAEVTATENSSSLPHRPPTSRSISVGASSGGAVSKAPAQQAAALPTKRPPSPVTYPPQSKKPALATKSVPREQQQQQPTNLKPAPTTSQANLNPFTMAAKRPAFQVYVPGPVPLCADTAADWIYPIHESYPVRDYQLDMSKTAVLHNTLVSLPTGLGKTLIASVVLYNFYRWFPTGKVLFLAPTLPLVNQQVKACYDIVGIPAHDTALLTGKVAAREREGLWKERRVFFCSPQTVQRDIESERCPAKHVVCVVLDEAHKASGAYAYVTVVQQLEEAGAKFRILGLSATPGTGIKQIQEVVTALRIHKIEARLEDDPSVKKYIHERKSEIVIVKQVSAVTTIERLLNDLISPVLERLRAANGLTLVRGNATLTPWCILKAQQDYNARTQDKSLNSCFHAAHSLVQLRSEIRRTGIGVVRSKMISMKNSSWGMLSKIVQGKEFQTAFDAVLRASSDPDNVNELAQDRKLNNPKLMKLDEILTDHFEKARTNEESSRAIVFTQWRDSVSEIVAVLASNQPLLRARHFVGQGKSSGGANKNRVDQSCASLKGMKQKEQQAVIREFREGKYNILVCTCIGEEGLDIGEVDLIVNYDSLSSPIRMIQRVGRTGRKRDGRVVCLVSEGAEEQTMKKSKTAEKTLGRALKQPDSFTVTRSPPMFPQAPVLRQLDMSVAQEFHFSQVGGNGLAVRIRSDETKDGSAIRIDSTSWRLNAAQEMHRQTMFGNLVLSSCPELRSSGGQLPQALRKRLLRARTRSISSHNRRKEGIPSSFGNSRGILLGVERLYGKQIDNKILFHTGTITARSARESNSFQQLFPLERSSVTDGADHSLMKKSRSATVAERRFTGSTPISPSHLQKPPDRHDETLGSTGREEITLGNTEPQNTHRRHNESAGGMSLLQVQNVGVQLEATESLQVKPAQGGPDPALNVDEFRLPTQSSSSSSSEDSDEDVDESEETPQSLTKEMDVDRENTADKPTEPVPQAENDAQDHLNSQLRDARLDDAAQETFRLPTQESSSEDDESSGEGSIDQKSAHSMPAETLFRPPEEICVSRAENSVTNVLKEEDAVSLDNSQESGAHGDSTLQKVRAMSLKSKEPDVEGPSDNSTSTPNVGERRIDASSNERDASTSVSNVAVTARSTICFEDDGVCDLVDTPTPGIPCGSDGSGADLVDTPQCHDTARMLPPPTRTLPPHDSQDDANDIVCAVCFDGHSPEDNPIVLCDGPNNDHSCPVAVHKLCYPINVPLEDTDNWQCDGCAFRQQHSSSKSSMIHCFVCHKNDAPLRQMPDSNDQLWFHPQCRYAVVHENARCRYCSQKGGTRCAFEGCRECAHPHCGLRHEQPWLVVAYAASDVSTSRLSSDDVIGCNIYCPQHREKVCRSLGAVTDASAHSRYVIVPSRLRDNSLGIVSTGAAQRKRLRKKSKEGMMKECSSRRAVSLAKSSDVSVESVDEREQKRQRVLERMKQRQKGMQSCPFIDNEADVDSDQDDDVGEEEEARRIEEEEALIKEFINDSSQLGYTQDDLDRLGLTDTSESHTECGAVHRRVDAMKERMDQFATPIFNRRMLLRNAEGTSSNAWDRPTPHSAPSSLKGLGNMHFIRSVLEHHRNGGEADDIENMYHSVAQDQPTPDRNPAESMVFEDDELSDSENCGDDEQVSKETATVTSALSTTATPKVDAPSLTAEQIARIERNRQEALKKRQRTLSQK